MHHQESTRQCIRPHAWRLAAAPTRSAKAAAERAGVVPHTVVSALQCVWYGADASKAAATVVPTVVKAHRAALGNLLPMLRKHRVSLQQLKFS
jgi:streptogramin lyase